MTYSVAIHRPLAEADPPVQVATYEAGKRGSPLVSVTIAAAAPLGYTQATLTFAAGAGMLVPPGAHVAIAWDGSPAFEGIRRRAAYRGRDQQTVELQGYSGFALDVNPWQTDGFKASGEPTVNVGLILARALAQATAPRITAGQPWGLPNVSLTMSELSGRTPQQIATQVQSLTNYDLLVFDHRLATLVPRLVPDSVQYAIDPDDLTGYEVDDGDQITRITATYTDPLTGAKGQTPQLVSQREAQIGFQRAVVRDAGTVSLAGADAWALAELARGERATVRGSIGPRAWIRGPDGGAQAGPLVRPGEWVQFEDPEQENGALVQLPIVGTSCDAGGLVTLQLGERPLGTATNLATLGRAVNAVARGTNALTGGPA